MSKGYIVYPQGDFDGNAFCVDAESAAEAAQVGWAEYNWPISSVICVLPFEDEIRFCLSVEVDDD